MPRKAQVIEGPAQGERANAATRAKMKYNAKTYNRYNLALKQKEDAAIIADIEAAKARGLSPADYIRQLYREAKQGGA